jgi:hypothetical protein
VHTGTRTYMSRGYAIAFAITAPVAPATANPHGGRAASLDWPAMLEDMRKLAVGKEVQ